VAGFFAALATVAISFLSGPLFEWAGRAVMWLF
jgi:hypothetical protein